MPIKKTLLYALAQFFVVAFQWVSMLYLPLFFKAEGISDAGVGALVSVFSLATILLVFPLGILSDRLPPRPMLAAGAVVGAGAYLLMPCFDGLYGMGLATALAGAGFTLSNISLFSLFFKQIGPGRRGAEVSVFNIGGIMGAGFGASIGGYLIQWSGDPRAFFPLALSLPLVWTAITLFLPQTSGIAFPILEYRRDLRRGRAWLLIAILFVTASHAGFEQAGYTLLQTKVIGLDPKTVGNLFFILSIWMCVVTAWTGREHDRAGEKPIKWMAVALILSGVFMAASGSAKGPIEFLLYRMGHTGGDAVVNLLVLVIASCIFPRKRAGGAFAFALTINTAAFFLFANLGGLVGDRLGIDRAFHLSGLIEVAGGIALLASRNRLRHIFRIGIPEENQ